MLLAANERPLVLLVDDAPANLQVLVAALKSEYRIKTATDGEAALSLADLADRPSLIILDVMMPGLDGIEVLRRLRASPRTAEIPVIFLSADDSESSQIDGLELGAVDYLTKPVNTAVLRSRLRGLMRRRQDEAELRVAAQVFNQLSEAIFVTDRERAIVRVNPAFTRLTGYTSEEMAGKAPCSLAVAQTPQETFADIEKALRTAGSWQGELWDRRKGGDVFPAWLNIAAVRDEQGETVNYVGSFTDITERKRMEELLLTQKLNAVRQLTGGMAHDFNNILGIILGFADLAEMRIEHPEDTARFLKEIKVACDRARRLTGKLLMFSRREASTAARAVDLNQTLIEEKSIIERALTARIQLRFDLAGEVWSTWIDEGHLRDAVLNMAINALHAMPEGGELVIRTENIALGQVEAQSLNAPAGEYVRLTISDTGTGMETETLKRVFEPFFTTKGEKGTGLGMSQVFGFVQQSKGAIRIQSEVGRGTAIELLFPRYGEPATDAPVRPDEGEVPPGGAEKILVVDDDPKLRELFQTFLVSAGYLVWCAQDGREALDLLKNHQIDLMLSDVVMPGIDGYTLAGIARSRYPNLRVQMVSGFSEGNHPGAKGADLYARRLEKPLRAVDLLSKVRSVLDEAPT